MSYAVVQSGLETPALEQLKSAFRSTEGLTEIDALALGHDALGILARGYDLELATALKDSLARAGIAAEVVADGHLPPLPESFALHRIDCTPEALLAHDTLDRVAKIEWTDIFMIAAGKVPVSEFTEVREPAEGRISEAQFKLMSSVDGRLRAADWQLKSAGKRSHWTVRPVDTKTKEELHERHLLEIFLANGALRYSINADKSPQLFVCLAERFTNQLPQNFLLLIRDLIRHAPHAALNRGAYFAQENAVEPFAYPNKIAFYNEIVWLLWQAARQSPAAEESSEDAE